MPCVERVRERDEACDRNIFRARLGVDPRSREQGVRVTAEGAQARSQHLAPLPERRCSHAPEALVLQGRGWARGTKRTTDEVTLGGGTNALGAISNMIFASVRQPASTASRP